MSTERTIRPRRRAVLLLIGFVSAGCAAAQPVTPGGFAAFTASEPFRAVSPDGVVFRVRREENPGGAALAFWKEAVTSRMKAKGYELRADGEVGGGVDARPGFLLELAAPLGLHEHGYLLALFVRGEELVVVEASGPAASLASRRGAIVTALESSRF
jgi:hypothetical protein